MRLLCLSTLATILLCLLSCARGGGETKLELAGDPGSVKGVLKIGDYAGEPGAAPGLIHTTEYVRGARYEGMEDNDLRGFVDGRFKYAWSQVGQNHVRVGRKGSSPRWGEWELFRFLHRWSDLRLPSDAEIVEAEVSLGLESGPDRPVRLLLYPVKADWNPGRGGTLGNNVSPPREGEPWWDERSHPDAPWAYPGVGFASERPDADTSTMPLAEALFEPGDGRLVFGGEALADYVERRVRAGRPLLFLFKASDLHEDTPGTVLEVYSASQGDSREVSRRPRLILRWRSASWRMEKERPLHLEYGRTLVLPALELEGPGKIALSFEPEEGSLRPRLEVRGGREGEESAWLDAGRPVDHDWAWAQARVVAAPDPVRLGEAFTAEHSDTWIRTAPPEDQLIRWVFTSPTGVEHHVLASYSGENLWSVSFTPDELGPWSFTWHHDFTDRGWDSALGSFDLLPGELPALLEAVDRLIEERHAADPEDRGALTRHMVLLMRLERALVYSLTPEEHRSEAGRELRRRLDRLRAAVYGKEVPEEIPMVPDKPPLWQRERQAAAERGGGS